MVVGIISGHLNIDDVEGFFLLFTRLTIVASSLVGVVFYGALALGFRDTLGLVPRWMYAFATLVLGYLLLTVGYFVAVDKGHLSWQERTGFGLAMAWSIASQLTIHRVGEYKVRAAFKKAHDYKQAVEEAFSKKSKGTEE